MSSTEESENPGTKPLYFGARGFSLGYFVMPFVRKKRYLEDVLKCLERAKDMFQESHPGSTEPLFADVEIFQLAGRCDLLLAFEHNDFRFSNDIQNALTLFPAKKSTWIHAIPYKSHTSELEPEYKTGIMFQLLLRTRRLPYQGAAVQTAQRIAAAIKKLLDSDGTRELFRVNLYTTLGWPDCLLWGSFHGSPRDYIRFFVKLERIGIVASDGSPSVLFRKRLTITGFHLDKTKEGVPSILIHPQPETVRAFSPFVLAQTATGSVHDAEQHLRHYAQCLTGTEDPDLHIVAVDGKWDLLMSFDQRHDSVPSPISLERLVGSVATVAPDEDWQEARTHPIEKLETLLLAVPLRSSDPVFKAEGFSELLPVSEPEKISDRLDGRLAKTWEMVLEAPLTAPLRNELCTHLSLLQLAARDTDNRPEVANLIHGSLDALQEMRGHLDLADELCQRFPEGAPSADLQNSLHSHMQDWCFITSRAVRQRAIGSFGNLFNQPFSAPAIRGSLQKMLFTADGLIREFFGFLPKQLTMDPVATEEGRAPLPPRAPRLVAAFSPTTCIRSLRYLDIVEIPSRYAFSLQIVLPQLWHEVAQCIFFRQFNTFVSTLQHDLVTDLLAEVRQLSPGRDLPSPQMMLRHVGDHFSDVVVFLYGFACDFELFSVYLCTATTRALEAQLNAELQRSLAFCHIVDRLVIVRAVKLMVKAKEMRYSTCDEALREVRKDEEAFRSMIATAAGCFFDVDQEEEMKRAISKELRSLDREPSEAMRRAISRVVGVALSAYGPESALRTGVLEELRDNFKEGKLVEIPKHLLVNEVFLGYYVGSSIESRRTRKRPGEVGEHSGSAPEKNVLREVAALGFSALQAFRDTDGWTRGRILRKSRQATCRSLTRDEYLAMKDRLSNPDYTNKDFVYETKFTEVVERCIQGADIYYSIVDPVLSVSLNSHHISAFSGQGVRAQREEIIRGDMGRFDNQSGQKSDEMFLAENRLEREVLERTAERDGYTTPDTLSYELNIPPEEILEAARSLKGRGLLVGILEDKHSTLVATFAGRTALRRCDKLKYKDVFEKN